MPRATFGGALDEKGNVQCDKCGEKVATVKALERVLHYMYNNKIEVECVKCSRVEGWVKGKVRAFREGLEEFIG